MDNQKNLERIRLEVLSNGTDIELLDELVATDFIEHSGQPGLPPTREGFKQAATALKTAFPDLHYVIEDAIESGDRIVHRLTASGTMKGDFMGMPATGKRATWTEIHIGRVANGRLAEHWGLIDQLNMLAQLGLVQALGLLPARAQG